ncbi:hypothetical protein CYMTET_15819 [Cymbomonas tetramitiformis]|uniref:Uncharacterized protein n=1 Tax=Cymbomonas tetramitiformis TaxID=36881 RepID=A0AAE0GDT1_9CHLO|nr:hypothetical protein CYMTET_15819 [Cymbomonas tetramitiformis]
MTSSPTSEFCKTSIASSQMHLTQAALCWGYAAGGNPGPGAMAPLHTLIDHISASAQSTSTMHQLHPTLLMFPDDCGRHAFTSAVPFCFLE